MQLGSARDAPRRAAPAGADRAASSASASARSASGGPSAALGRRAAGRRRALRGARRTRAEALPRRRPADGELDAATAVRSTTCWPSRARASLHDGDRSHDAGVRRAIADRIVRRSATGRVSGGVGSATRQRRLHIVVGRGGRLARPARASCCVPGSAPGPCGSFCRRRAVSGRTSGGPGTGRTWFAERTRSRGSRSVFVATA